MSESVIRSILKSLVPEAQPMHVLDVWETLPERKVFPEGRLRPVIVFGMEVEKELLRHMPGYPGEEEASQQGVFYLSLPCSEKGLTSLRDRAKQYAGKTNGESATGVHPQMILLLRSFKHVCENMKSALSAQANSARMLCMENPAQAVTSLEGFNNAIIERLFREHAAIKFWVADMRKVELEQLDCLLTEIRRLVTEVGKCKETRPEYAVEMALQCATEVENMMKVLKQAVERLDHD